MKELIGMSELVPFQNTRAIEFFRGYLGINLVCKLGLAARSQIWRKVAGVGAAHDGTVSALGGMFSATILLAPLLDRQE